MRQPFENIRLSQLLTLCYTVVDSDIRQVDYIRRKYSENALWFEDTLELLKDLKIISTEAGELFPSDNFFFFDGRIEDYRERFLQVLFSAVGPVSEKLREFLIHFHIETDKIIFKAKPSEKMKFSDTRALLLELEFIFSSFDNESYLVNPIYAELFLHKVSRQIVSPETLRKRLKDREDLGLTAEVAVIEFEIARLATLSIHISEIEHTAKINVAAGYDIISFENYLDENSKRIERYVEVKAVSIEDYNFFWSRNEILVAKIFGEKYFLYLLPVISSTAFDFANLLMIANPYKNVYLNQSEWKKEEESISFSKSATS